MHLYEFIKLFESYKQALAKYTNEGGDKEEVKRYLDSYKDMYERNVFPNRWKIDIGKLTKQKSWPDFKKYVEEWEIAPSKNELKKSEKLNPNEYVRIDGNDKWNVVIPLSHAASCTLGRRSSWCTTKKSQNMFSAYVFREDCTLIYALHKDPKEQSEGKMAAIRLGSKGEILEIQDKKNIEISEDQFKELTGFEVDDLLKKAEQAKPKTDPIKEEQRKLDPALLVSENENKKFTKEELKLILRNSYAALDYVNNIKKEPFGPAENAIATDSYNAYHYAQYVIKDRWPEAEPVIMKSPELAYNYANEVIKGRWPEVEPAIMKSPGLAYNYANKVIKDRWPEAEPYILENVVDAVDYATNVIKGRWPELESKYQDNKSHAMNKYAEKLLTGKMPLHEIRKYKDKPGILVDYAKNNIKDRWPEAEPYIMKSPRSAYRYADEVIKGRWPEAEPYILQDGNLLYGFKYMPSDDPNNPIHIKLEAGRPMELYDQVMKWYRCNRWPGAEHIIMKDGRAAYLYAKDIIKGRWPEAEPRIARTYHWNHEYVKKVINKDTPRDKPGIRWPEAEPYIMKNPYPAYDYARSIIKGRWPEAEPVIAKSEYYPRQYDKLFGTNISETN